jgi:hypothetical protein
MPGPRRIAVGDKIVLPEDAGTAIPVTATEYIALDGRRYATERAARWASATHARCSECQQPNEKRYTICSACREKRSVAKHAARKRKPWDGEQMVYSEVLDRYFVSPDDAMGAAEDDGSSLYDLRMLLCEPVYPRRLEPDYFCDDLPEDGDMPDDVLEAIDVFNEAVKGIVLSWRPSEIALLLEDETTHG